MKSSSTFTADQRSALHLAVAAHVRDAREPTTRNGASYQRTRPPGAYLQVCSILGGNSLHLPPCTRSRGVTSQSTTHVILGGTGFA